MMSFNLLTLMLQLNYVKTIAVMMIDFLGLMMEVVNQPVKNYKHFCDKAYY